MEPFAVSIADKSIDQEVAEVTLAVKAFRNSPMASPSRSQYSRRALLRIHASYPE
jgi:hypothetical protein